MIISEEIIRAIGLSIAFTGVMLSLVVMGIIFFIYKIQKRKSSAIIKMGCLIAGWTIFLFLNVKSSITPGYVPDFWIYSIYHLISLVIGTLTYVVFLIMLPKLKKEFNHKLLTIASGLAVLSLLMRAIFPLFQDIYLTLLQRAIIVIPPLLGFFMIIELITRKK